MKVSLRSWRSPQRSSGLSGLP